MKKNKAVTGILVVIFLSFALLMIFASYTMKNLMGGAGDGISSLATKSPSIAVVEINGVIMESKDLVELLHRAEKDSETKAIILRINSPGGAVGPTQEVYEEVRRIDNKYEESEGKEGKPIYASFGSMAASGGYYLGAATRKIFSNGGTITGSIGVIMAFPDLHKLFEWAMIGQNTIKAGRYKDIGAQNRAMSQEEKDLLTSTVAVVHDQFIRDILKTRKKVIKGNIKELAQGQIFSGEEALKHGLVDEISGFWEAGRKIHKELNLEGEFGFKYIEKKKKKGIWAIVDNLEEASLSFKDALSLFQQGTRSQFYYR